MKPPKCKAMDDYASLLVKIGELEGAIEAAKRHINCIPAQVSRELKSDLHRIEAARYLYWCTDIPAENIASGFFGMEIGGAYLDQFLKQIGPLELDVICDRCRQPMQCHSRTNRKEILKHAERVGDGFRYPEGYNILCPSCWDSVQRERAQSYYSHQ
ncbi:MAG: hypothetical protein QM813_09255 [Verrucomicrobiota bacterium]